MIGAEFSRCPSCGPTLLLRLSEEETKVRCARCIGTPIALSQIAAIKQYCPDISKLLVYEASSRGAVLRFLRRANASVVISEYFDGVRLGDYLTGVQCQDLESLTFSNNMFDLCTNTEVMEHVSDDIAAFRELHRILKPDGKLIFTVPFASNGATRTRASGRGSDIKHLMQPEYHGDRLSGSGSVLVYRDYGVDIVDRLIAAGFATANIFEPNESWFGYSRKVIVAKKSHQ